MQSPMRVDIGLYGEEAPRSGPLVLEKGLEGRSLDDVLLWLGGVDRPMRILAEAKMILRAEGRTVTKALEVVRDVDGEAHQVLAWRLASKNPVEEVSAS